MPSDPKPSGQRRRRNRDAPPTVPLEAGSFVLDPTRPDEIPPLPMSEPSPMVAEWWVRLWDSPMAKVWIEADLGALHRLAILTSMVYKGAGSGTMLAEIRQLEDRFGLTPLARRRLAFELGQREAETAATSSSPAARPVDDDRWLRAVE